MSEKLFRFLLHELGIVRIRCKACEGVVEVPIEKLGTQFKSIQCPLCRADLAWQNASLPPGYNPLKELASVAKYFAAVKDRVEIEFTVPDPKP